jgi:hypothetical protein
MPPHLELEIRHLMRSHKILERKIVWQLKQAHWYHQVVLPPHMLTSSSSMDTDGNLLMLKTDLRILSISACLSGVSVQSAACIKSVYSPDAGIW